MKTPFTKVLIVAAMTLASTGAGFAQAPGAANPEMPSVQECKDGYKDGMKWSEEEFKAACIKVTTNAVPSGQKK